MSEEKKTTNDPNPKPEENQEGKGAENNIEELLESHPELKSYVQSEADRRVTEAQKKWSRELDSKLESERERVKREAREAKLLEDGKTAELLDLEKNRTKELTAKLESFERRDKVNQLLDKKEITDPLDRAMFHRMGGDLTELDGLIDQHIERNETRVTKAVEERLKTNPPPKGSDKAPEMTPERAKTATNAEKSAYIAKHGYPAWEKLIQASYETAKAR